MAKGSGQSEWAAFAQSTITSDNVLSLDGLPLKHWPVDSGKLLISE
jgi:hypothetical protein